MKRIRVEWSGAAVVGPGVSTFYLADSVTAVGPLLTFFGSIANKFPAELSWTVPNVGDVIDVTTGELTAGTTFTGGGGQVATGTDSRYAQGVGARIRWSTAAVFNGRRLAGSTFLVPLEGYCYDNTGSLDGTNLSQMQTAVNTLVGALDMLVWHRPTPGGSNGGSASIIAGTIPDKVSTLRSRRT